MNIHISRVQCVWYILCITLTLYKYYRSAFKRRIISAVSVVKSTSVYITLYLFVAFFWMFKPPRVNENKGKVIIAIYKVIIPEINVNVMYTVNVGNRFFV